MPPPLRQRLVAGAAGAASVLLAAIAWLRSTEPPTVLPPFHESDVDANTSLVQLRRVACSLSPPMPALRTKWLPFPVHGTHADATVASVTPFLILHEMHVGEQWFAQILRTVGVPVIVPQEKGNVRDAARRWLAALALQHRRVGSDGRSNSSAAAAVGLSLSAQALRILNHGVGATASLSHARPLKLVLLTRRNRLKHAVSTHARNQRRGRADGSAAGQPEGVTNPLRISELQSLLDAGVQSYSALACTARELLGRLNASAASQAAAAALEVDYEDLLYDTSRTAARILQHLGSRGGDGVGGGGSSPSMVPSLPSSLQAQLAVTVAKQSPNSLCVRLSNWREVCRAVEGTVWAADVRRTQSPTDAVGAVAATSPNQIGSGRRVPSVATTAIGRGAAVGGGAVDTCDCVEGSAGLVLGGAHHKTGTVTTSPPQRATCTCTFTCTCTCSCSSQDRHGDHLAVSARHLGAPLPPALPLSCVLPSQPRARGPARARRPCLSGSS